MAFFSATPNIQRFLHLDVSFYCRATRGTLPRPLLISTVPTNLWLGLWHTRISVTHLFIYVFIYATKRGQLIIRVSSLFGTDVNGFTQINYHK